MIKKYIEVERRIVRGFTAYYLVTRWYVCGLLIYEVSQRKE